MTYSGGVTVALHAGVLMIQTAAPRRSCEARGPHDLQGAREAFEQAYWVVRDKA